MNLKVALVELGGSHQECLYTQIRFLKAVPGVRLTLVCDDSLQGAINHFDSIDQVVIVPLKKGIFQWQSLASLWKICKQEAFDKIIFNTAQGKIIKRFLKFPFPKSTIFYGTLHDIKKLENSHTQRIISRKVKNYFLLHHYLGKQVRQENYSSLRFAVYYPVIFPQFASKNTLKSKDELWICVPGQVENKRRDYPGLFQSIEKQGLSPRIKILLLGRCAHQSGDGAFVKNEIKRLAIDSHVQLYDEFIGTELYHQIVAQCDYILPLIHPQTASVALYEHQITGAFNLAVGYQLPLLLEKEFVRDYFSDFETVIYQKENLASCLNSLEAIPSKRKYQQQLWSFQVLQKNYLDFLNISIPENSGSEVV